MSVIKDISLAPSTLTCPVQTLSFLQSKKFTQLSSGFDRSSQCSLKSFLNLRDASDQFLRETSQAISFFEHSGSSLSDTCFPLASLEEDLKYAMNKMRRDFLPEDELKNYGNKHRNLVEMVRLKKALQLSDLEVPLPRGLSSEQVETFLRKNAPEVFVDWQKLAQLKLKNLKGPFLQDPEVTLLLDHIESAIAQAFAKKSAWSDLNLLKGTQDWVELLAKQGQYLMVRSTGAEDSEHLVNAGGNQSRAYVLANQKSLCEAISAVVTSYFSKASLQNRLNGNTNPFTEKLSLAVTL